ncbi:hypothetical protein [Microbacterium paraoxydans]|uniref:hypothetical protein n=1 Tax=Microbacterium paraoxydans TaxID=199592 RepID=UPI003AF89B2B
MMSPTALRMLAVLALGVSALSGCAPTPEPTPTPSPAFTSEEEAFAAAEATFADYIDALNRVDTRDPTSFEPLFELSSGAVEAADRKNFSRMHAEGQTLSGETTIIRFEGVASDEPYERIQAYSCLDVSDVEITNQDGSSAVSSDRPDVYALELVLLRQAEGTLTIDSANRNKDVRCSD